MHGIYDLLGSIVIGGMILVMILGFNTNIMEGAAAQTYNTTVQAYCTTTSSIIEADFSKMGYRIPAPPADSSVAYADTSTFEFRADINNDGTVDRVRYSITSTTPPGNSNPKTRTLRRTVNNVAQDINVGLTRLRFSYYDALGNAITAVPKIVNLSQVKTVKVEMNLESIMPYQMTSTDTLYTGVAWQRAFTPMNFR